MDVFSASKSGRLICRSPYTREYTVVVIRQPGSDQRHYIRSLVIASGQVLTCVRYNWCHMCQVVTLANGRALITVNTCLLTNFECRLQLICNYSTREVTWLQWPTLAELAHVLFPLYKSLVHHDRYPDKISSTFQKSPTLLVGRLNIWISNGRLNGDLSGVLSPVGDVMNPQTIPFPTPSSVPVLTFLPQSPLVCEVSLHSF